MPDAALRSAHPTDAASLVLAAADFAATFAVPRAPALEAARRCLIAALSRGFETLRDPERAALIGPIVPGALMPGGARVPGTSLELEPAQAAFCISLMIRPVGTGPAGDASEEASAAALGALLAVADYQARKATMEGQSPPSVRELLAAMLKALEIEGTLATLAGARSAAQGAPLRRLRAAVSAVAAAQLAGTPGQIARAVSYAALDGAMSVDPPAHHARGPAGWATADTLGRAVRHACHAMAPGRPAGLTAEDLELMDLAGGALGAGPAAASTAFSTALIDRLPSSGAAGTGREAGALTAGFQAAVDRHFPARQAMRVKALFAAPERLDDLPVSELIAALVTNGAAR